MKRKSFTLKSGNKTTFKSMGASPVKKGGGVLQALEEHHTEKPAVIVKKDDKSAPQSEGKEARKGSDLFAKSDSGGTAETPAAPAAPTKHGKNAAGDKPHTKFKTETEHEEYHDKHPTKDLNKAEMKKASDEYAKTHFPGGTKKSERDKFSDRETQREIEKESSPDWSDEQRKK